MTVHKAAMQLLKMQAITAEGSWILCWFMFVLSGTREKTATSFILIDSPLCNKRTWLHFTCSLSKPTRIHVKSRDHNTRGPMFICRRDVEPTKTAYPSAHTQPLTPQQHSDTIVCTFLRAHSQQMHNLLYTRVITRTRAIHTITNVI